MNQQSKMYLDFIRPSKKLNEGMEITDTVAFMKRLSRITAKSFVPSNILFVRSNPTL